MGSASVAVLQTTRRHTSSAYIVSNEIYNGIPDCPAFSRKLPIKINGTRASNLLTRVIVIVTRLVNVTGLPMSSISSYP